MASFSYENQGTTTYLVYEVGPSDELDTVGLGMLINNSIPSIAQTICLQINSTKYIKYNVSSKIPMNQFFSGTVTRKRLLGVFKGIVDAMLSVEEYMLDINSVVLSQDYIFADVSTFKTELICLPVKNENEEIDLRSFFKEIMFNTRFDQTENCDYVARIINYLNSAPVFSVIDFKEILDGLSENNVSKAVNHSEVSSHNSSSVKQQQVKRTPVQQPVPQQAVVSQPAQPVQPVKLQTEVKASREKPKRAQQPVNRNKSFAPEPKVEEPIVSYDDSQPVEDEDKISLMYLMQHYNKENAAKYKAQKEARKNKSGTTGKKPASSARTRAVQQPPRNASFAVPGQSPAMSIPGTPDSRNVSVPSAKKAPANHSNYNKMAQTNTQPAPVNNDLKSVATVKAPSVTVSQTPMNFGETTVLGGGGNIGETTVLNAGSPETKTFPHLIRIKNNEKILLDKPVFRIGKERSYVDYFVSDNTAVSRSHANIISRDGQYFVVDTNSTNHTYVNGGMIQSNVETPLSHGAKLRLANEEFEFRLY